MELAAVVITPDEKEFKPHSALSVDVSRPFYSPLLPILGNDVRRMWTDRVHKLGVRSFWLGCLKDERKGYSQLCRLAKEGIERLLMIKLKFYAEMDLADLLRFHCESQNPMTEVHDSRGRLGVSVLDRPLVLAAARKGESSFRVQSDVEPVPYAFTGYAKRILSPKERQELVGDGLAGTCALRPLGKEIRERVWLGDGVNLASSAQVLGPAYIGDRAIVRAGATVGPFVSVERDCVVDCATTLERSTVLPETYLAPGLLIRKAIVDGGYMEDLCSGTVVDLQQSGLAKRTPGLKLKATAHKTGTNVTNLSWLPTLSSSSSEWRKVQL